MKSIILAGGSGTRLWPVSRKGFPKQFIKINGPESLLCQSAKRLLKINKEKDICVITNEDYKYHVIEELGKISKKLENNIILEPAGRNTAPAIALSIKYCIEKLGASEKEVIFITPSDHIVQPEDKFAEYVKTAADCAKSGRIVVFGIKPAGPETGYGYIKTGDAIPGKDGQKSHCHRVVEFVEKPDLKTAEKYVKGGNYYWNSGMFAFKIETIINEFERFAPEIYKSLSFSYDDMVKKFESMPNISIDYAVMEKTDKAVLIPLKIKWSDVGSWDNIFGVVKSDQNGNVKVGNVIDIDTRNTLIMGEKRLIATVGLEDAIIIETDDAVLVAQKGSSQKVRDIVEYLKKRNRKEAVEHTTIYRPWGGYTILEEGERYKIKKVVVKPKQKLSLQMHHHRSEHWVVIKGVAKVTKGTEEIFVHENESIYVPKSTPHRLENPGKVVLEVIEVQNGEYVQEDDILRFDDIYGRCEKS